MPVELIKFSAKHNGKYVDVTWSTLNEKNNDYFTIEKSSDGLIFEELAVVNGAGNSTVILNYKVTDQNPITGTSYYRLKQTDYNGQFTYSQIESVKTGSGLTLSVFPNPVVTGQVAYVNISGISKEKEVLLVVYDMCGKELHSGVFTVESSVNNSIAIDPSEKLIPGIYIITTTVDQVTYKHRLIVS